jgi:hypothetical protein
VLALVWIASAIGLALIPGITLDAYSILMLVVFVATFIPVTVLLWRYIHRATRAKPAD